jgi:hypothetical protein
MLIMAKRASVMSKLHWVTLIAALTATLSFAMPSQAKTQDILTEPLAPLSWARPPSIFEYPERESGVLQARVDCEVGDRGTLRDCEIRRLLPDQTRFGAQALRSARRARLREGTFNVGARITFEIWACSDMKVACVRQPWPQNQTLTTGSGTAVVD